MSCRVLNNVINNFQIISQIIFVAALLEIKYTYICQLPKLVWFQEVPINNVHKNVLLEAVVGIF